MGASPELATSARMKVFFVGDNRTTVNWGRGASMALRQLLSGSFDITGRVTGDLFDLSMAEAGYVGTLDAAADTTSMFRHLLAQAQRGGRFPGTSSWNSSSAPRISLLKIRR